MGEFSLARKLAAAAAGRQSIILSLEVSAMGRIVPHGLMRNSVGVSQV